MLLITCIICINVLLTNIIINVLLMCWWWYDYPILGNTIHIPSLYTVFENNNHSLH